MRDKGGIGLISLELSKRLKEAGLEWEPQIGDVFYFKTFKDWGIDAINSEDVDNNLDETEDYIDEGAWLLAPDLEQLLAKIRELGYKWFVETDTERYFIRVVEIKKPNNFHVIFSDSPANAAASALLWILEGGTSK